MLWEEGKEGSQRAWELLGEEVASGEVQLWPVPLVLWSVNCVTDPVLPRGKGAGLPVPISQSLATGRTSPPRHFPQPKTILWTRCGSELHIAKAHSSRETDPVVW